MCTHQSCCGKCWENFNCNDSWKISHWFFAINQPKQTGKLLSPILKPSFKRHVLYMLVYAGQRTQCTLFSPLAGTVCCNMLQCVAGFCSQSEHPEMDIRKIYYAATHCNTLQLTATHCNAMFQVVLLQNNSWWMFHADDSRPIFTFLITFAFISYFTSKYYRENTASNTQTVQNRISSIY